MRIVLGRSKAWTEGADKYLSDTVAQFSDFLTTAMPKMSRKASLSSFKRNSNDEVSVYYMFLDGTRVCHAMNSSTQYYSSLLCQDVWLASAVHASEAIWISPFSPLTAVQADCRFVHLEFTSMIDSLGI